MEQLFAAIISIVKVGLRRKLAYGDVMAPCEVTDDYYLILKISQNATLEEVKKSYRRLAIALHPDRNPNKPDATASFQIVCQSL